MVLGGCIFIAALCAAAIWALTRPGRKPLTVVPVIAGSAYTPASDAGTISGLHLTVALTNPRDNLESVRTVNATLERAHLAGSRRKLAALERREGFIRDDKGLFPDVPVGETKTATLSAAFPATPVDTADRRALTAKLVFEDQLVQKYKRCVTIPRRP